MTHTPKIGDENPYQETGAINWHESIGYHVLFVTENRYQKNWYRIACQTRRKPVYRFSGTGFWRQVWLIGAMVC